MDPLDYMVEDCWLHLFQFLPAKDKQALCETCETFKAMLQPQKTQWGFELILPCILQKLSSAFSSDRYRIRIQKTINEVTKLRLVCKSWRAGCDKYCGTTHEYQANISDPALKAIQRKYEFSEVQALENFLTFFKSHGGNPFIGRRATIYVVSIEADEQENEGGNSENEDSEVKDENNTVSLEIEMGQEDEDEEEEDEEEEDEEEEEYDIDEDEDYRALERANILKNRELYMELLTKYGKEINHLFLRRIDNCPQLDAYKFFRIVLINCPNLLSMDVSTFVFQYYFQERNNGDFQNQLAEYFELNPLPKMHSLQELKLTSMNDRVERLMLEAYGPNLRSLQRSNGSEIPVSIWENMRYLQNLSLFYSSFEQTEKLLRAIQSPLETLRVMGIGNSNEDSSEFFKIDKFLLAIQHLPLKDVEVTPDFGILKEAAPFPVDFPKHKTILKFSIHAKVFTLNFLQFLPELQNLFVNKARCPLKYFKK